MQDIESFAVNRTLEEMKEFANQKEQSLYDKIVELNVRNTIAYSGCKKSDYNSHFLGKTTFAKGCCYFTNTNIKLTPILTPASVQ